MEKALALGRSALVSPPSLRGWDRVYLGSNFCAGLLPRGRDVEAALGAGAAAVTLCAPLLTDAELAAFLGELKGLLKLAPRAELSCPDLGLADSVRRRFGRKVPLLLARPSSVDYIRMEKKALARFMKELGFRWLETDEADMARQLPPSFPFPVAFHYPLKYLAMSRLCPVTASAGAGCAAPCGGKVRPLRPAGRGRELLQYENAYFLGNAPSVAGPVKRLVRHSAATGLNKEKVS